MNVCQMKNMMFFCFLLHLLCDIMCILTRLELKPGYYWFNSNMAADVLAPCSQVVNNHGINLVE